MNAITNIQNSIGMAFNGSKNVLSDLTNKVHNLVSCFLSEKQTDSSSLKFRDANGQEVNLPEYSDSESSSDETYFMTARK